MEAQWNASIEYESGSTIDPSSLASWTIHRYLDLLKLSNYRIFLWLSNPL